MCEYCGCQALPVIEELTYEHDRVVGLISDVRAVHAAGDVNELTRLARRIAAILGPHTQVEEGGLFPPLAGEFPAQVEALEAEHRQISRVLDEAADGVPADPAWPERLLETVRLLREHILAEQDGVFPAALSHLNADDWDVIEQIRERVGTAVPNPVR
jgi:hemerythrin-like domain-containing protein